MSPHLLFNICIPPDIFAKKCRFFYHSPVYLKEFSHKINCFKVKSYENREVRTILGGFYIC